MAWSSPVASFGDSAILELRDNTFRKICAVPRMADNCALLKICGKLNLPYQAFAFSEIVPSASFRMGITVTLVPLWILLISRSRSWYLSTFSSQVVSRISWSAGTAMSIIVHSCVSLCTTVISGRLRFSRLSVVFNNYSSSLNGPHGLLTQRPRGREE